MDHRVGAASAKYVGRGTLANVGDGDFDAFRRVGPVTPVDAEDLVAAGVQSQREASSVRTTDAGDEDFQDALR